MAAPNSGVFGISLTMRMYSRKSHTERVQKVLRTAELPKTTKSLGGRNHGDVGERAFTRLKSAASVRAYKSPHHRKVFTTGATVRVSSLQG